MNLHTAPLAIWEKVTGCFISGLLLLNTSFAAPQSVEAQAKVLSPAQEEEAYAFSCTFRPPDASIYQRNVLFAHYIDAEKPVSHSGFINWLSLAYPGMTNLQCLPMSRFFSDQVMDQNEYGSPEVSHDVHLALEYIYSGDTSINTVGLNMLSENAYGQRFRDNQDRTVAVAFPGHSFEANGCLGRDTQPFKFLISIFTPCFNVLVMWPLGWSKAIAKAILPHFIYHRIWVVAYGLWYAEKIKDHLD